MMRNVLISLAAAASALAIASPASAQWASPQHQPYGYGTQHYGAPGYGMPGYGMPGYGYRHGQFWQIRQMHNRVERLRQRIQQLHRGHRLSMREAHRLDRHALELHRRIDMAARRGLHPRERLDVQRRIEGLRHAIRYEARDGNRWGWNGHGRFDNPYGYYGNRHSGDDRRRDHWDDRWEHDRDD